MNARQRKCSRLSGWVVRAAFLVLLVLPRVAAEEPTVERRDRFEAEQKALRVSLECYRIDYDRYPEHLPQLTTPIAYCRPEVLGPIMAGWEYVADATGDGYEARNLEREEFTFCFNSAIARALQDLHGKPFQDYLRMAETEDKPYLRSEILGRGREAFIEANRQEQGEALVALRRLAADPSSQVRAAALGLLGEAARPELLPVFFAALDDESYRVRWAAVESLGELQEPSALPRLRQLLNEPDPRTRRQALSAIARFRQAEALPALLEAARDSDPGVRSLALQSCAKHREERAFQVLKEALADPVESVRVEAVRGLVDFPGEAATSALVDRFAQESSTGIQVRILDSLRALGAEEAIKSLSKGLNTTTKAAIVKDDLRQMATAIEARYVDNSSYLVPDEVFVPGSVFARRYGIDPEVIRLWNQLPQDKRPTYGLRKHEKEFTEAEQKLWQQIEQTAGDRLSYYQNWERNRSLDFGVLTTPVAYLTRVPRDPFNENFLGRYRYSTPTVKQGWADFWMLISNGPDEDVDIAPEYVVVKDDRSAWLHAAYPFEETPLPLRDFLYDPTNGAISNGDIVRFGPFSPFE